MLGKFLRGRPVRRFASLSAIAIFVAFFPRSVDASIGGHTWQQYWDDGSTCWYAKDVILRSGSTVVTKFTCNSDPHPTEWDVATVRFQCQARTFQFIAIEIYDDKTGALLAKFDDDQPPERFKPNTMGAELAGIVC
jgi:hypothetical protein